MTSTHPLPAPTMSLPPLPQHTPMATFEAFLAWAIREEARAEWVAGEVVPMMPVSINHQRVLGFLNDLVKAHVRPRQLGEVFFAPIPMRLATRPSGREPDLLFVAAEHIDRIMETFVNGPADLVVESISPESDARDRGDKFVEYEAASIPEYWLIDLPRQEVHIYHLDATGRYRRAALDSSGILESVLLPGLLLKPAWLWQRPLPTVEEALREIAPRNEAGQRG